MDCENAISSTIIQDLNDDCLIVIFSMLPFIDQIKIQRVCKRWRLLSRVALNKLQRFEVYNKKFWGIGEESKVKINRDIFNYILKLYGRKIIHIDLTYEYGDLEAYDRPYDENINIVPGKKLFKSILDFCPNITSLNVGQGCQKESLQYIAENFRNLICFTHMIKSLDDDHNSELKALFSNNRNLKSLKLYYTKFPFPCFSYLNSESIEEIHLLTRSSDFLRLACRVFRHFQKIHTLTIEHPFDRCSDMVEMLRTIASHLQNLKKLYLHFYPVCSSSNMDRNVLFNGYNCMITLTELEELHIEDESLVNDDFMETVCNNCKKLKTLKIDLSYIITDEGMSKIKLLPNLQNLYVKRTEVTGSFLMSEVPKLKNLVFDDCGSLQDEGIIILLLSSQHIENLEITSCRCINGTDLIDTIIKNIKDRKFKNVKIKINAAVNVCYWIDIEILEISCEYYTRATEKLCTECSRRRNCDSKVPNEQPCRYCLNTTFIHQISNK